MGDLLTFARHYEPDLTDTDINELLQRTVALRSYELRVHNIAVHWDLDPDLPAIRADAHRLQQVILNLIFNAEQAVLSVKDEGLIRVSSQRCPDGRNIRFAVADNGPGIPEDYREKIFEKFYRVGDEMVRQTEGSGLGLYLARELVRQMGGSLVAESPGLGCGTTFRICLPLAHEEQT